MEFNIETWSIKKLIDCYEKKHLNLNPPYQRGDIWSLPAKKKLIDSIKQRYPLPAFFIYQRGASEYEMVDGQQRTRTILGYSKGIFPDSNREKIDETDAKFFFEDYKLAVVVITKVESHESIEDFYYRVNKFGTKLNRPEILKSQFFNTLIQNLVERLADSDEFDSLELFTQASEKRLNDVDFVGELITLMKFGITDKKLKVDQFFEESRTSLTEDGAMEIEHEFLSILEKFTALNSSYPLKKTRYSQRNDFYTYFNYICNHRNLSNDELQIQYKLLLAIEEDISPSSSCFSFHEYADNCVTQSNSKKSRELRLLFFDTLLLNKSATPRKNISDEEFENNVVADVLNFYKLDESHLIKVNDCYLVNPDSINNAK